MHNLFVYGTLKGGFYNNYLLRDSEYATEFLTEDKFIMTDHGSFPSICPANKGYQVLGELYFINDDTLRIIDRLEGHPNFYKRELIIVEQFGNHLDVLNAWTYFNYDTNKTRLIKPNKNDYLVWEK